MSVTTKLRKFSPLEDSLIYELAGASFTAAEAARVMGRNEMSVFNRAEKINVKFGGDAVKTFRRALLMGAMVRRFKSPDPDRSALPVWVSCRHAKSQNFPAAYMEQLLTSGLLVSIGTSGFYCHIDAQLRPNHERDEHLGIR